MDGELPENDVLNEPAGVTDLVEEPTEGEVNRQPREPSIESLFFYAARDYCRRNKCPDQVYDFAAKLRAATKDMSYGDAKQTVWEMCHPCAGDDGREVPVPIPETLYGPMDD